MGDSGSRDPAMTLRLEYADGAHLLDQWRRCLSLGKTFVRTREPLTPGTRLRLKVGFPELRQHFVIGGVVRGARVEAGEPGVDVEIRFADGGERERLATRIQRAAAGDPELCARVVRLLIVEDNPHVGRLIAEGLQESGRRDFQGRVQFAVEAAADGATALAALKRGGFHMLVTDVYLPVMDGAQLIREVRAGGGERLPVLAVSAGGPSAGEQALAAGADLFLEKPLRLSELVAAVKRLVRL